MVKKCVVLAAGKNTRLNLGKPKSLIELEGCSLLERHICNFKALGCNHFCIVTGYNPDPLREVIPELSRKHDVHITEMHNSRYDLENGYSVSVTQEWIQSMGGGSFFLTMGDHIFHTDFLKVFADVESLEMKKTLCLAVDKPGSMNEHIDVEDVTKVLVGEKQLISEIGKTIELYNYYDTGLFYLSYDIFNVLNECFDRQQFSISDMVNALVTSGEALAFDCSGHLWNDIDNQDDLRKTLALGFDSAEGC